MGSKSTAAAQYGALSAPLVTGSSSSSAAMVAGLAAAGSSADYSVSLALMRPAEMVNRCVAALYKRSLSVTSLIELLSLKDCVKGIGLQHCRWSGPFELVLLTGHVCQDKP